MYMYMYMYIYIYIYNYVYIRTASKVIELINKLNRKVTVLAGLISYIYW